MEENTKEVKPLTNVAKGKGYEINIPMGPILSMDKSILPDSVEVTEEEAEVALGEPLINEGFDIDKVTKGILANNPVITRVTEEIGKVIKESKARKQEAEKVFDNKSNSQDDIKKAIIEDVEFE
jgi:hypothetical protein